FYGGVKLFEDYTLDIRDPDMDKMILHDVERIKGIHTAVEVSLDSSRSRCQYLTLAIPESAQVKFDAEKMLFIRAANNDRVAFNQRRSRLISHITEHSQQVHVAELALEFR